MTGTPKLAKGEEYVVFYSGGPSDGQSDTRISTDGTWESEIQVLVAVDGMESLQTYAWPKAVERGGQVQVTYFFDAPDSEQVEDPEDRGEY